MKNCKMDTRGHIISYENDNGDTITDYSLLKKALGLNKNSSSSGDYDSVIGGSLIPDKLLWFLVGAIIGCVTVFLVLAWIFFNTGVALAITIFLSLALVAGIIYLIYGKV